MVESRGCSRRSSEDFKSNKWSCNKDLFLLRISQFLERHGDLQLFPVKYETQLYFLPNAGFALVPGSKYILCAVVYREA